MYKSNGLLFKISGCKKLTNINLSGLSKVKSIGQYFTSFCKKITTLDLSSLTQLESIGDNFLSGCVNLREIICYNNKQKQIVEKALNQTGFLYPINIKIIES